MSRYSESSDTYPGVVAILGPRWRVISCGNGMQWVLQCRNRAETVARDGWRGRSFCRTKEALLHYATVHAGPMHERAWSILQALPIRFPEGSDNRAPDTAGEVLMAA